MTAQAHLLDAIGARLALPTVERGYHQTIQAVERARVKPFRDFDLPAVNYWADSDTQSDVGAGWVERELTVMVDARTRTRDRPFVDVAFELAGDLWAALWRDPSAPAIADPPSPRLGGTAVGLALTSMTPAVGEGQAPFCGVLLSLSVRYRVRPSAPFTLIE